jgi:hypothetical protein
VGWRGRVVGCLVAVSCVACAGPSTTFPEIPPGEIFSERRRQQVLQIHTYYAQLARLNKVAYRIAQAGRADCKDQLTYDFGFSSVAPNDLPERFRHLAIEALGQDAGTSVVMSVAEGSPAAKAGIAAGDELVSLNGRRVPATKPADWIALFLIKNESQPVQVEIRRGGQTQTRVVSAVQRCSLPVLLATEEQSGAYTDYRKIVVFSGMLRVAQTDDELAAVVGHELAHVTMGHGKKRAHNRVAGSIGGVFVDIGFAALGVNTNWAFTRGLGNAGSMVHYTNFEREADYVGAYYAARAGYDLSAAERIWRAMSQENPKQLVYSGLHPTSPERFLLIQKTAEEIADKKRRNAPLIPEAKPGASAAAISEPLSGQ